MRSGTLFNQGDILIVPFPFTDLSTVKQRPVLVISNDSYNQKTKDIIVCGITSNLKDADHSVLISNKDLSEGNIPKKSRIKVAKIFTLEKSIIKKRVAKVREGVLVKVKEEVRNLI